MMTAVCEELNVYLTRLTKINMDSVGLPIITEQAVSCVTLYVQ